MDADYGDRRLPSIQNILSHPPPADPLDASRARPQRMPDPFRPHHAAPPPPPPPQPVAPLALTTPRYQPIPPPLAQDRAPVLPAASLQQAATRPSTASDDAAARYTHAAASAYPSSHTSPSSNGRSGLPVYHTSPSSLDSHSQMGTSPEHLDAAAAGHASPKQPPRPHQIRYVQGHGDCYIMSDGTYVPCSINGDPVNPEFGVTKAGKPRKRLAQACMTCREKKIKCQPGEPKCQQCTKLNRECKRPAPSSGSGGSGCGPKDMPPVENKVPIASVASRFEPLVPKAASPPPLLTKKRSTADLFASTPDYAKLAAQEPPYQKGPKRQCSNAAFDHHAPASEPATAPASAYGRPDKHASFTVPHMPPSFDVTMDTPDLDPFEKDPYLTVELLDLYFLHRGRGPYEVLPRDDFMNWVVECRHKRREDKMVLYILLALGSRFSKDRKKKNMGAKFAKKAAFLEKESAGENSLQLAQTRLYFLLYCFAEGNNALGWDYLASGMGTCNALGLNTEQGINDVPDSPALYEYGLSRFQLTECRRRTFFAGYCMDRFIGHNSGHSCLVYDDDVCLRLPAPERNFQQNIEAQLGPLYSEGQLCEPFPGVASDMAHLVQIVGIWGDVMAHAWRSLHRPGRHAYLGRFEQHYAKTYRRVAAWEDTLPEHLVFSPVNTAEAVSRKCASIYFVLHTIRFVALIKLNRNADVTLLPSGVQSHNISRAFTEARNLLTITSMLSRYVHNASENEDLENALSQPFPSYATLAACEVVAAGGVKADRSRVQRDLSDAASVMEQVGRYWFAPCKQQAKVNRMLMRINGPDADAHHGVEPGLWRMPATKDGVDFFPEHYDLINGSPDDIFYDALRRT